MPQVINTLKRKIVFIPFVIFCSAFTSLAISDDSLFEEVGIPDGFELLAAPQVTEVDVYYGGHYLQSVRAVYTPHTLEFTNPDDVVHLIPGTTTTALITEALSGSLDRHDSYHCSDNTECPTYSPDVAGIIFDESRFRVQLLVNGAFLQSPTAFAGRYLPLSSAADHSFLQTMNVLLSGAKSSGNEASSSDTGNSDTWTVFGRSLVSFREKNIEALWDYDKEQHLGFRSFSLNEDAEGFSYGAGLMQSRGFGLTFSAAQTMIGGRFGSSQRTLLDNGITQSTRLQVFRANRGRVEVLRDGRLIYTEFQEAGNQLINTQSFPSGAYEITIRLYDGDIKSQEETRYFVKTTFLPPADEPQYFVEVGSPVNMQSNQAWPSRQKGILARTGYNWRVGETSSLTIASALLFNGSGNKSGNEALVELSGLKLGERYQFGSSVMIADRQRYGFSIFSFINMGWSNLNLNYRKLWSDPIQVDSSSDDYLLLSDGFSQGSVSIGIPLGKGNLNLRHSYNKQDKDKRSRIIDGIVFDYPLWKRNRYEFRFRTDLSKANNSLRILAGIELTQRLDQWNNRIGYQSEYNRNDSSNKTDIQRENHYRIATTWYDRDTFVDDIEIDGFAEKQSQRSTLSAGVRYTGRYLNSSFHINQIRSDNRNTVNSYSGGVSTSLITNGETIAFGGEGQSESGLLVKLNGQMKGDFNVIINGQRQGYGSIGNSTLINLPAFETYKVFIQPRGESYYEYDQREREFTLYPGNIQTFSWGIEQVLVIIGQLQYPDGNPIANATLNGAIGLVDTDPEGFFQARINTAVHDFTAEQPNGERCQFSLPEAYSIKRGIVLTGALTCIQQ